MQKDVHDYVCKKKKRHTQEKRNHSQSINLH